MQSPWTSLKAWHRDYKMLSENAVSFSCISYLWYLVTPLLARRHIYHNLLGPTSDNPGELHLFQEEVTRCTLGRGTAQSDYTQPETTHRVSISFMKFLLLTSGNFPLKRQESADTNAYRHYVQSYSFQRKKKMGAFRLQTFSCPLNLILSIA